MNQPSAKSKGFDYLAQHLAEFYGFFLCFSAKGEITLNRMVKMVSRKQRFNYSIFAAF